MIRVGIINVTGYAGAELARLLYMHPEVKVTSVTGRTAAGKTLAEVFPHLWPLDLKVGNELDDVDFAFSALPHGASAEAVAPLVRKSLPVVDISADFRLTDAAEYQRWYDVDHPAPELLADAVYGLTELKRSAVRQARLVANPGCYPTGALLALAPAVKGGIIEPDVVIDAKSGISGAGRSLGLTYHYAEANESVAAYAMEGHRHLPEIVQELELLRPKAEALLRVTFQPHLVPMTRGILTTCYAPLADGRAVTKAKLHELYEEFYRDEPFVRVTAEPPQTKHTWGNNLCLLYPTVDSRVGRLVVVSCIDNLVKGAAGQAVQNMNLMLGFSEAAGLDLPAVYP
ncbi:MAG: N-acetyl-gamma-glutamyl-phosphate reductase [Dehalococcoidia bacterium SM23_28_2]|nr:MAG: N-acetyl-gamma-glutamyl-phosphate reductase [Dehalococcoidia bacterium SM23_28_2]